MSGKDIFRYLACFCMGILSAGISKKLTDDPFLQSVYLVSFIILGIYFLSVSQERE